MNYWDILKLLKSTSKAHAEQNWSKWENVVKWEITLPFIIIKSIVVRVTYIIFSHDINNVVLFENRRQWLRKWLLYFLSYIK